MEQYQRELLIARISAGYIRYRVKDKLLFIYNPTLDILYEANELYSTTYNKALQDGLMTDNDIYQMLVSLNLWSETQEKDYSDVLPKHIEYWKEELYKSRLNKTQHDKVIKYLAVAREELIRLANIRHRYDYATCFGLAAYAKTQFIIENCTFLPASKKRYKWSNSSLYKAMIFYQENILREETLRELSHSHPWDNIWAAGKRNGQIFTKCGVELSIEQQRLILWSGMYDNIAEYPDCPPKEVIENDDMLDGWLSLKRKNKTGDKDSGITNSKIANSDEIFLPSRTLEEARKINELNDRAALAIKRKTMAAVDKHGEMPDIMLPHMQERLMMEATQKLSKR